MNKRQKDKQYNDLKTKKKQKDKQYNDRKKERQTIQ